MGCKRKRKEKRVEEERRGRRRKGGEKENNLIQNLDTNNRSILFKAYTYAQ